jgi:hypothetical protein
VPEWERSNVKRKKMGLYGTARRFHANRTFGSDSDYCSFDVDIDAGSGACEEAGKNDYMPIEPEAMGVGIFDVLRR